MRTTQPISADVLEALTVDDKIELIDELWRQLHDDVERQGPDEELRAFLRHRLSEARASSSEAQDWRVVMTELRGD